MLTDGATLTRAIHYPAMEQAPGEQHVWAGEHADINLITALPRATAAGLQLKTPDGEWSDVAPPEGSAIINTGLMLERLSNGMIPPGIHRVVSGAGQQGDRYSVVQFAHPTPWTILAPMPSTVTAENPLRYSAIAASDALDKVLYEINLVEDGRRVDADD
jgi:isopenicillin N synthase-like dioxygenase